MHVVCFAHRTLSCSTRLDSWFVLIVCVVGLHFFFPFCLSFRFLKENVPECKVWIADPEGSALTPAIEARLRGEVVGTVATDVAGSALRLLDKPEGGTIAEGVGTDRKTANFACALDDGLIDGATVVNDADIVNMGYHLVQRDGIWVGPSAAMNVVGAVRLAKQLGPGHTIVTVLCDSGSRYSSKMYSASWLKAQGLTPLPLI